MRQALETRRLPRCEALGTSWLGRLRARLFGTDDRKKAIALQHCSQHFLRDIGLLDDRRVNRLLRDDVLYRS
jgi:hypothetical protein